MRLLAVVAFSLLGLTCQGWAAIPAIQPFLDQYCMDCHDGEAKKGGLDLTALSIDGSDAAALKKWVRVFDRVAAGEGLRQADLHRIHGRDMVDDDTNCTAVVGQPGRPLGVAQVLGECREGLGAPLEAVG